jgi:hypothetical protein
MREVSIQEFGAPITLPFKRLLHSQVLDELDGPRIFSFESEVGLFLCYVIGDFADYQAVIVTPCNGRTIQELLSGSITVREALLLNWSWLTETDFSGEIRKAVKFTDQIPDFFLPKIGTMLYRSLQPLLSVKLEGASITEHNVRASVVRQALDAGTVAIKRIVDNVWNANSEGRPKNVLRFLSDLPTQRFSYGSFQVDFKKPDQSQLALQGNTVDEDFQKIGSELDRIVTWASGSAADNDLDIQDLKALERLVPPLSGQVETVTISGGLLGRGVRKTLNRTSTQKLKRAMKSFESEQVLLSYSGRIREIDMDALTFKLRDLVNVPKTEIACGFEATLLPEVFLRITEENLVTLTGRQVKGTFEVSDISIFVAQKEPGPIDPVGSGLPTTEP